MQSTDPGSGQPGGLMSPSESACSSMGAPGSGVEVGYVGQAMERVSSPASPTRAAMLSPPQRAAAAAAAATQSGSITAGAVSSPSSGPSSALSDAADVRGKPKRSSSAAGGTQSPQDENASPLAIGKDKVHSTTSSSSSSKPRAPAIGRSRCGVATGGTASSKDKAQRSAKRQAAPLRIAAVGGRGRSPSESGSTADVSLSGASGGGGPVCSALHLHIYLPCTVLQALVASCFRVALK